MEDTTKKIKVNKFDEFLGENLIGNFEVKKYLTPLDVIEADKMFRELLGGVNPILASDEAKESAFMISQLNVRLVKYPSWFKSEGNYHGSHLSPKVLQDILNQSVEVTIVYQKEQLEKYELLKGELQKKIETGRVTRKDETNASNTPLSDSSDAFEDDLEDESEDSMDDV